MPLPAPRPGGPSWWAADDLPTAGFVLASLRSAAPPLQQLGQKPPCFLRPAGGRCHPRPKIFAGSHVAGALGEGQCPLSPSAAFTACLLIPLAQTPLGGSENPSVVLRDILLGLTP